MKASSATPALHVEKGRSETLPSCKQRGFSFVHSTRFETCSSSSKPESMDVDLLLTFGVLVAVFIGLVMDLLSPDGVLLGSLIILVLGGSSIWDEH